MCGAYNFLSGFVFHHSILAGSLLIAAPVSILDPRQLFFCIEIRVIFPFRDLQFKRQNKPMVNTQTDKQMSLLKCLCSPKPRM